MKPTIITALAGLLLIGLAGCQSNPQPSSPAVASSPTPVTDESPEGQIRTAIQAHLAHNSNLNLNSFDTDVKQVTIQGDHAEAHVNFQVKGGPGVMQLTYQLQKQGGTWSVVDSNPVGSNFSHPALNQGQAPGTPGTPGAPGGLGAAPNSLADTLRSFKQGGFSATPNLPPGHPPVNATPR